jgi:hypothetical protein
MPGACLCALPPCVVITSGRPAFLRHVFRWDERTVQKAMVEPQAVASDGRETALRKTGGRHFSAFRSAPLIPFASHASIQL